MKNLKRLFAVLVSLALVFGMLSVPVFAATLKYEDEARTLNKLGLFKGVSSTEYKPNLEDNLLREEAVALLLRMFALEEEALRMKDKEAADILKRFNDADQIASWAVKYIAYAVKTGVIAGRPDGNFAPKNNLLGREYAKMVLAMLGYVQGIDFQYEFSIVEFCTATGFSQAEAVVLDTKKILRDDVVGMSFKALKAKYVSGEHKGNIVIDIIVGNHWDLKEIAIREGLMKESVLVSVENLHEIEVKVGELVKLPNTIKAYYSDGKVADVLVKWPVVNTSKPMPRTEIKGTIEGTDIQAKVYITVNQPSLAINNVSADNLIEIEIVYNQDISDNAEVNNKENYTLDIGKIKDVSVNGNIAVLRVENKVFNQRKAKLTVSNKILHKNETFEFTFFDRTLPEILSIEVAGPKSLSILFTEPIETSGKVTVKTGNSTLSVNANEITTGVAKVIVPLYSSFTDGREYTITVEGFKDFAGYNNVIETRTITYIKDQTPPVAEIESATQEYVVVKFNKPVSGLHKEQFSHTFTAWTASKITSDSEGKEIIGSDSSKTYEKVYVWFYTGNKVADKPIPEGNNILRILGKVSPSDNKTYEIKDLWGNRFETETFTIRVTADKTAPEVKKISAIAENAIEIEFSKNVSFAKENLEILDISGRVISGLTFNIDPKADVSKFTVTFNRNLAGKTIIVNIKKVYDASINNNMLYDYSDTVEITDKTPPNITKVTYGVEKQSGQDYAWFLYVFFNEDVEANSGLNTGNYYLKNGNAYTKLSGSAEFYAGEKIVRISLTSKEKTLLDINRTELFVTNVKDIAGNEISPSYRVIGDMEHSDNAPYIEDAIATAPDTVELIFSEELATYDMDAFRIRLGASDKTVKVIRLDETILNSGKTKLTLTINGKLAHDTSNDKVEIVERRAISNLFNVHPAELEKKITDGIKPEVIFKNYIVAKDNGDIVIRFTEKLVNTSTTITYVPFDLVITKKSNDTKLVPGIDYRVTVDNTKETLRIDGEDVEVYGKVIVKILSISDTETYYVSSKDALTYITDNGGNTAKPFTDIVEVKGSDLTAGAAGDLTAAKQAAEGKKQADYTESSWTEFQTEYTAAKKLPEKTNNEKSTKANAINAAIAKLVLTSEAEFKREIENAKDGDTIKLTSDITTDVNISKLLSLDLDEKTINGNVNITTNTAGTINISSGTINGTLTVNAPNATVNNQATVSGNTTIKDVKVGTWNENVDGNSIVIEDDNGITLKVAKDRKLKKLTLNTAKKANVEIQFGENASIEEPIIINKPVTLISARSVNVKIAKDVTITIKKNKQDKGRDIKGANSDEAIIIADDSSVVLTKDEFNAVLADNNKATITLGRDITLTEPLAINRKVTIDGSGKTLTINSGEKNDGNNSAAGLGIFADEVNIKNLKVVGNHGDNLIEIYYSANLENVSAIGGKKTGIYVNNDRENVTLTVNFKNITTSGNGWNAGIGLLAQKANSKVIAKFSGEHKFAEDVAVYNEGTRYPSGVAGYEITGLNGYSKVSVPVAEGKVQEKWVRVILTETKDGIKLETSHDIEGLKTYISLVKHGENNTEIPVAFKSVFITYVLKTDNDPKSYDMMESLANDATSFRYGPEDGFKLEKGKPQTTKLESYTLADDAPMASYTIKTQVKQDETLVAEIINTFTIPVQIP